MGGFGILGLMMRSAPPPLILVGATIGFYLVFPILMRAAKPREPTGITPELKKLLGEPPRGRSKDKRP
jgi:hypothetical protein